MSKNAIQKVDEKTLKLFLSNLNANVMSKTNCKFCNSSHRVAAEEYYEQSRKNIQRTKDYLTSVGEDFSYRCVRNHLRRHYIDETNLDCLQEYGNDLAFWVNRQLDERQRVVERIAILEREMILLAALSDSDVLDDRRRSADVLKKLSEGISALEGQLRGIDNSREPVEIMIEKLREIISQKIEKLDDNALKRILLEVIEELSQSMADVFVEQK